MGLISIEGYRLLFWQRLCVGRRGFRPPRDRRLEAAEADRNISAILLLHQQPGGSVVASDEIYRALTRMEKPVVAYAGGWLRRLLRGPGADRIVAHPSSIVGSIVISR